MEAGSHDLFQQPQPTKKATNMNLTKKDRTVLAMHIGDVTHAALGPWDSSEHETKSKDDDHHIVGMLPVCARNLARTNPMWLIQFAQCGLDLLRETVDPEGWPEPRCTGEEVIIAMAYRNASGKDRQRIDGLREYLCQDIDVDFLFDPEMDGIEDSDEGWVKAMAFAPMKPGDWFEWFDNVEPRR